MWTLVGGVVSTLVGLGLVVTGLLVFEAGRGGYGRPPLPMLKQPTEHWMLGLGLLLVVVGGIIVQAGVHLLAVAGVVA